MEHMSPLVKWWSRMTAAVSGAALALVIPVHAWAASNGVGDAAIEAARGSRRRFGGFGFVPLVGGLCCLFVVGAIVLGIVVIARSRQQRRPPS